MLSSGTHDVRQRWINRSIVEWALNGIINGADADLLWSGVETSTYFLLQLWCCTNDMQQRSVKQPDRYLRVDTGPEPRIVVEPGWSESFPHLRGDKNLWLRGNASVV
ncbi:hypothetical protein GB937_005118 [Aspergillus fischeri]|nr:hypothetical protein GB937_005118 [Aspergillus fischeri]